MTTTSAEETELQELINNTFWTEKGHFTMASWWRGAHLGVGLTATIASGVAGATVLAQTNRVWPGVAALIATVAGGILTFLKPGELANSHLVAGRRLGIVRVQMRQTLRLDVERGRGTSELRETIRQLAADKAEADSRSPHVSDWAMRYVGWRVRRGDYTAD